MLMHLHRWPPSVAFFSLFVSKKLLLLSTSIIYGVHRAQTNFIQLSPMVNGGTVGELLAALFRYVANVALPDVVLHISVHIGP